MALTARSALARYGVLALGVAAAGARAGRGGARVRPVLLAHRLLPPRPGAVEPLGRGARRARVRRDPAGRGAVEPAAAASVVFGAAGNRAAARRAGGAPVPGARHHAAPRGRHPRALARLAAHAGDGRHGARRRGRRALPRRPGRQRAVDIGLAWRGAHVRRRERRALRLASGQRLGLVVQLPLASRVIAGARPATRGAAIGGIAAVAGSAAALLTWGATVESRLEMAQQDAMRQGMLVDPVVIPLLDRAGTKLRLGPPPTGRVPALRTLVPGARRTRGVSRATRPAAAGRHHARGPGHWIHSRSRTRLSSG